MNFAIKSLRYGRNNFVSGSCNNSCKILEFTICLLKLKSISLTGIRTLVKPSVLGLDHFNHKRKNYSYHFKQKDEYFRQEMHRVLEDNKLSVYLNDLKSMIYICKKDEKDLNLLHNLLKKFMISKNNQLTDFQFGPEIMRLFYILKEPILALKVIQDNDLKELFNQVTSYTIIMDNLFYCGHYQEIVKLFYELIDRKITIIQTPKEPALLALAACYKINTSESYEEMLNIINRATKVNSKLTEVHHFFAAALAFKRNNYPVALELLCKVDRSNSLIYLNLKIMALSKLGKVENALHILSECSKGSNFNSPTPVLMETMDVTRECVEEVETKKSFEQIEIQLQNKNLINYESLDSIMCKPLQDNKLESKFLNTFENRLSERQIRRERFNASFNQNKRR